MQKGIKFMKRLLLLVTAMLMILLTACAGTSQRVLDDSAVKFTDALGQSISVFEPKRVIVASGSFADTWILAGGALVGTTQDSFTDDSKIAENVADIGALHSPSLEQVIALEPDLLILSADISGHLDLRESLSAAGINTAYFSVETLHDYLAMLKICTDITGRVDLYEQNGTAIQAKIDNAIAKSEGHPSPKVLLLRAGSGNINVRNSSTMAGAMLKDLGCTNIADSDIKLLDNLSMEAIIADDPDYIFVVPMGDSLEKSLEMVDDTLKSNPAWAGLTAVKNGHYTVIQKDLFHQKPNNRWGEAYEILASILYGGYK
jgi:iron complex transport system substrate-binding protein